MKPRKPTRSERDRQRADLPPKREQQIRKVAGIIVATYQTPMAAAPGNEWRGNGKAYSREEIRSIVLEAAKSAVCTAGPAEAITVDPANGRALPEPCLDAEGGFRTVINHEWTPMDDFKAERIYEVVEGCVDRWLDMTLEQFVSPMFEEVSSGV